MNRASSVLGPIIRRLGIGDGVMLARIKNDWHTIFEKTLSLHMSPSRLSEGELLLNVDPPIWIQQLTYHKAAILKKLSPYGIKTVRFRAGKISKDRHKPVVPDAPAELSTEEAAFISDLVSEIGDDELRNSVRGAAEKAMKASHKNRSRQKAPTCSEEESL